MDNSTNQAPKVNQQDQSVVQIRARITAPGKLLSDAIQVYRDRFTQFMNFVGMMILAYIPMGIIFWIFNILDQRGSMNMGLGVVLGFLALLSIIFFIYLSVAAQVGQIFVASGEHDRQFKEIFTKARKFFWPFLVVSLLAAIFVILWSILFIIPGIIFAIYYSLVGYIVLFENFRSRQAIKRSKQLVTNYWWATFGRILFILLIYYIVIMLVSLPVLFVDDKSTFAQVWNILTNLISVIIAPIYVVYQYKIFKDLQQIKGAAKDI